MPGAIHPSRAPARQPEGFAEATGIRSVKGTIRIDESDPDLSKADAALRELFEEFLSHQPVFEPALVDSRADKG